MSSGKLLVKLVEFGWMANWSANSLVRWLSWLAHPLFYLLILACYESTNKLNEKQQHNKQQQIQIESIGDWNHISAIALEPNVVKLRQVKITQHKKIIMIIKKKILKYIILWAHLTSCITNSVYGTYFSDFAHRNSYFLKACASSIQMVNPGIVSFNSGLVHPGRALIFT